MNVFRANEMRYSPAMLGRSILRVNFKEPIEQMVRQSSIICVDVFDTLLRRPYSHPTHLFEAIGCELKNPDFGSARKTAEAIARKKYKGRPDVTILQIYETLAGDLQDELRFEHNSLYARNDILEFLTFARSCGKPIIAISDMYLPKQFILDALNKANIQVSDLLVSSEDDVAKYDGSAYRAVAQKYNVCFNQMLHIGDNKISDYKVPNQLGINAALISDNAPAHKQFNFLETGLLKLSNSGSFKSSQVGAAIRDLSFNRTPENFWDAIGLYVVSPIAFGFSQWLSEYVSRHNIKTVVFVARDGWLPSCAFRLLRPDIASEYAYLSRSVLLNAGLSDLNNLVLKNATSGVVAPASDYVKRLGSISNVLLPKLTESMGGDPVIDSEKRREQLRSFFLSHSDIIQDHGRASKRMLYAYLEEMGLFSEDRKVAIVDIGWQGTGASLLQDLFPETKCWHFLYFGTTAKFLPLETRHSGFFFQLGEPEPYSALVSECVEIVELFFTAPEKSAVELENREHSIRPVFAPDSAITRQLSGIAAHIEMGAKAGFDYFLEFGKRHKHFKIDASSTYLILENILRNDDLGLIAQFSCVPHQLGLGDSKALPLVRSDVPYWGTISRWMKGKPIKAASGPVFWHRQQSRGFIAAQKGFKLWLAKRALRVNNKGGYLRMLRRKLKLKFG